MPSTLPRHDVVLLGIGHTNAHVLRMWRMQPPPDARLTCISNFPIVTYSGMLPGVLAGLYPREKMEIDLVRLCAAVGARLIVGEVTGLDRENRTLQMANRPNVPFDVLSIGIGSVPRRDQIDMDDDTGLLIKPMQTFLDRLDQRLRQWRDSTNANPTLRIAIVGGGAGGTEVACCLPNYVRNILGDTSLEITLVTGSQQILSGVRAGTSHRMQRELNLRGVRIITGRRAIAIKDKTVTLDNGESLSTDLALLATDAVAPPLLARLGLPTDDRGFLLTKRSLQTVADAPIFAVGDSGTIQDERLPKAGVYAVRQGPVLWDNIGRLLRKQPLIEYQPQRSFLKLFNLGDGRAIGELRGVSFSGKWAWRWKDRIDQRFMAMYQDYGDGSEPKMMENNGSLLATPPAIRCAGCGGKVSGSVLARVLARLDIPASPHVLVGLDKPDDAAVLQPPGGRPVTVTVDFFAAPFDDPYLLGRLAALHSASDVFALGAKPLAALAMATIPVGPPRQQEQLLYELLAGSLHEFRQMGATLVGGHTIEGPQLTAGFTLLADQGTSPPRTKGGLRTGDLLVLTKPLGSGVLLAAHMRAQCRADWFQALVKTLLLSNQSAAELIDEFDIQGLTDVTGFGLAGHLLEMLNASDLAADLRFREIPLLPGASELLNEGLESTLAPANRAAEAEIEVTEPLRKTAPYAALFDPQTCGGLLLGISPKRADELLKRLREVADLCPAIIGQVTMPPPDSPRIRIVG